MTFKDLSIGDTFEVEETHGPTRYIKIELVLAQFIKHGEGKTLNVKNAVCIDEYSDQIGKMKFFGERKLVSHVNYS